MNSVICFFKRQQMPKVQIVEELGYKKYQIHHHKKRVLRYTANKQKQQERDE